jgi:hypothetical protein
MAQQLPGTDEQPQQPPQATPGCEPPPKASQAWYKRPIIMIPPVLLALGIVGWVVGGDGGTDTSGTRAPATQAPAKKAPAADGSTKPSAAKRPATKPGELPTARLGGTIQFADSLGKHAADITVARKKVATGSSSGRYVGLFVRVKAFQGGISVPRFSAVERGRRFDATCCTPGFKPELRVASTLHKGETSEGWVIFYVPKANGRLVMQPLASSKGQAFWVF